MSHTPGPWEVGPDGNEIVAPHQSGVPGGCNPVRKGGISMPACEVGKANARLIAAAPDLLAACEASINAIARFAETGIIRADELSTALQAAITKARGQ